MRARRPFSTAFPWPHFWFRTRPVQLLHHPIHPCPPLPLSTADKQGAFCGCRGQKLRLGKYAVKLKCHLTQWGPFVNLFSRTVGAGHENYFVRTPTFFTRTLVRHGTLRLSSNPSQPYWFVNFHLFMYFFYYNLCNIYLPHVRPGVKF